MKLEESLVHSLIKLTINNISVRSFWPLNKFLVYCPNIYSYFSNIIIVFFQKILDIWICFKIMYNNLRKLKRAQKKT